MAGLPSEEQGNLRPAETSADIEIARVSNGSASSLSGGVSVEGDGPNYRPLLQAASRGDWESITKFFIEDATLKTAKITSKSETVLHIAALSAHDQFVEKLVEVLCPEALQEVDCYGCTALHNAVLCGKIRMVTALVRSNPKLKQLADNEGRVPLAISAREASMHKEIAWCLAENTIGLIDAGHHLSSRPGIEIIIDLTYAGHHDITLYLVKRQPSLITMTSTRHGGQSVLDVLASMKSHFASGTKLSVLEAFIYKCIPVDLNCSPTDNASWNMQTLTWCPVPIKRIQEMKLRHMTAIMLAKQFCYAIASMQVVEITQFFEERGTLVEATVNGISELVKLSFQFFPELIWISCDVMKLMTYVVKYRQERTLKLFLKESPTKELSLVPVPTHEESKRMMLAAAEYNPKLDGITNVAGAVFQIQRELQRYKAVESWTIPSVRTAKHGETTYWNMFVENHKQLLEKGEKWVKDTTNSCMLVSTLIATVLFAAAFTVPGGNDNNTGVPLLLGQDSLLVFAISDVLGLFSSVMAILLFLAILTSRYEAQDFLYSLPKKIIMGLCFLFLSLAFMLVTFAATLTIVLHKRVEWVLIPITLLAFVSVVLFVVLQLPLLYQMVRSTYGRNIFCPECIWDGVDYTKQDR